MMDHSPHLSAALSAYPTHPALADYLPFGSAPQGMPVASASVLHFSGYDPRAAGGRQTIKLSLPATFAPESHDLELRLRSDLLPFKTSQYHFLRSTSGEWQTLIISFSSRYKEHGQYPFELELRTSGEERLPKRWLCSTVLLIPRSDATLSEIHGVFLATQKNVKVIAEDGAIAKLQDHNEMRTSQYGQLNIEVHARDAAVAQMDFRSGKGKFEIGLASLAWDEELIEVALPVNTTAPQTVPPSLAMLASADNHQAKSTTMVSQLLANAPAQNSGSIFMQLAGHSRYLRIFAAHEWMMGRYDGAQTCAQLLITHPLAMHRRISAQHVLIRRRMGAVELMDMSRYGTLLNGKRMDKLKAMPLQVGNQIELCASFRGIAHFEVLDLHAQAIVLRRNDQNGMDELLYLLTPETAPVSGARVSATNFPSLFHRKGQLWHRDTHTQHETMIGHGAALTGLQHFAGIARFNKQAYSDFAEEPHQ